MIASLDGQLAETLADGAILEVGGIGYRVHLPVSAIAALPERGRRVRVHTQMVVREDSMTLYGFPTVEQRDLFGVLLGVNGIGPKAAVTILGVHSPEIFRKAVAEEDVDALTMIPGVGKKTAQRMIIELKEKLTALGLDGVPGGAPPEAVKIVSEAQQALTALGYTVGEAREALSQVPMDADSTLQDLIKAGLAILGRA
jgi:holliday junction DNA helicase RuvA